MAHGSSQARPRIRAVASSLHHSSQQCRILNPLSRARDWTGSSWVLGGFVTPGPRGELGLKNIFGFVCVTISWLVRYPWATRGTRPQEHFWLYLCNYLLTGTSCFQSWSPHTHFSSVVRVIFLKCMTSNAMLSAMPSRALHFIAVAGF